MVDASSSSRFVAALDDIPEAWGGDKDSTPVPADTGGPNWVPLRVHRPVRWDGGYDLWWEAVDRAEFVHERFHTGEGFQHFCLARFDLKTSSVWGIIISKTGGKPHSCSGPS